ncbi:MAG: hypothetical protein OYL97_12645 [Candidatus Poribacteria bacterium]|nr:hypothetical protein [Candidatus Poribacteria bacterium]
MKLLVCSLLIALLIFSRAFAADDKLTSGAASLYHLASILDIEVSRERVENIVVERSRGAYVVNFVIIDTAGRIGIELLERNLNYDQLQALETPVIACLKTTLDDENDSEADTTVIADFIVVESATEKAVRVFGAPRKSSRAAATFISRDHFLEHWTGQVLTLRPALSEEATQLLQDIITGTSAYNAKLKSGEVEFSITLSERIRQEKNFLERLFGWGRNLLMPSEKEKEEALYEEQGYWHITYRFDGDRHFYDVKARKKTELNGAPLPNWKETHYQYRRLGKTLYYRANTDTEWKQHPPRTLARTFEAQFDPRWWSWPPWGFELEKLIRIFKPINVQQVNVEGIQHNFLTLQRTDPDVTRTFEIWLDPQKAYRSTRILTHRKSILKLVEARPDGKLIPLPPEGEYRLTSYTYQLAQFEPNIWFPKTGTMENSYVIGDEDKQPPPVHRRTTMQVHRAVFNMPISEKELGIIPDR